MFQIVARNEAKGIGVGVQAAEEPVSAIVYSQTDKIGIFGDAYVSSVDGIEGGGDFPDGEGLGVAERTKESLIDY